MTFTVRLVATLARKSLRGYSPTPNSLRRLTAVGSYGRRKLRRIKARLVDVAISGGIRGRLAASVLRCWPLRGA